MNFGQNEFHSIVYGPSHHGSWQYHYDIMNMNIIYAIVF